MPQCSDKGYVPGRTSSAPSGYSVLQGGRIQHHGLYGKPVHSSEHRRQGRLIPGGVDGTCARVILPGYAVKEVELREHSFKAGPEQRHL